MEGDRLDTDYDLKVIKEEMKEEEKLKERKEFQKIFPVKDEEMELFEYFYKKERIYRTALLSLSLVALILTLLILILL